MPNTYTLQEEYFHLHLFLPKDPRKPKLPCIMPITKSVWTHLNHTCPQPATGCDWLDRCSVKVKAAVPLGLKTPRRCDHTTPVTRIRTHPRLQDSPANIQPDPSLCVQSDSIFLKLIHGDCLILYIHIHKDPWKGWDGNSHVCCITDCWTCNNILDQYNVSFPGAKAGQVVAFSMHYLEHKAFLTPQSVYAREGHTWAWVPQCGAPYHCAGKEDGALLDIAQLWSITRPIPEAMYCIRFRFATAVSAHFTLSKSSCWSWDCQSDVPRAGCS